MGTLDRVALLSWIVAGAVTLTGAVAAVIGLATPVSSFGWFAYQPLTAEVVYPPGSLALTPVALIGLAVTVIGLLALAFLLGRRLAPTR
ncbi:MAG: hypothetical protein DI573_10545 [Microbacterium sp.]|uniref:hypothetical protein n=1 Tax=Microbacterium sp. TaxID=51671 RepID=UPI000DB28F0D|nr:hypothetical protein [Microbacterium sp.]PZU38023.1 MAG: hypothetical protein DI573_10545 [Microbacterium sp.]